MIAAALPNHRSAKVNITYQRRKCTDIYIYLSSVVSSRGWLLALQLDSPLIAVEWYGTQLIGCQCRHRYLQMYSRTKIYKSPAHMRTSRWQKKVGIAALGKARGVEYCLYLNLWLSDTSYCSRRWALGIVSVAIPHHVRVLRWPLILLLLCITTV